MKNASNQILNDLKHLLSICNDGKEGYKNAAENCEKGELKALFTTYSIQRAEFADKLRTFILQFGDTSENTSGGPLGALHRTWIDIKSALAGHNNKAVLDACISGERSALEAYDKALSNTDLTPEIKQALMQQRSNIHEALHHISKLENQYS